MPRRRQIKSSPRPVFSCRLLVLALLLVLQLLFLARTLFNLHPLGTESSWHQSPQAAFSALRIQSRVAKSLPDATRKEALPANHDQSMGSIALPNQAQEEAISANQVASTGSNSLPDQAQQSASGAKSIEGLVLGMAMGITADALFMFLTSLLRVTNDCHVVIFVDQQPPTDVFNTKVLPGLDRVTFELQSPQGLRPPWNAFHASNARYMLYADYMKKSQAAMIYRFVQVSDVRDIVFQRDPFANLRSEQEGVHAFLEEPEIVVGKESWNAGWVRDCFGDAELARIASKTVTCSGYTIGASAAMEKYLEQMAHMIESTSSCERNGVDQGVHNVLVHESTLHDSNFNQEMQPYILHSNGEGWVWTGGYVKKGSLAFDDENAVLNKVGVRYAVLHQYDRHQDLFAKLQDKYLEAKRTVLKDVVDCSSFDMSSGDVAGFDLEHIPVQSDVECCKACLGESQCQGFVYSSSRRHCWMKRSVQNRRETQGDMLVGFRK